MGRCGLRPRHGQLCRSHHHRTLVGGDGSARLSPGDLAARPSSFSPPSPASSRRPVSIATATTASSPRTRACASGASPADATTARRRATRPAPQAATCLPRPALPRTTPPTCRTPRSAPPSAPAGHASSPASTRSFPSAAPTAAPKHPVEDQDVIVETYVQAGAEPMEERDSAKANSFALVSGLPGD